MYQVCGPKCKPLRLEDIGSSYWILTLRVLKCSVLSTTLTGPLKSDFHMKNLKLLRDLCQEDSRSNKALRVEPRWSERFDAALEQQVIGR